MPRQCDKCKNVIYCMACTLKLKNKCGYCNSENVQFVNIEPNLMDLIRTIGVKCPNNGCTEEIEGPMTKHVNYLCKFKNEKFKNGLGEEHNVPG